MTVRSLLTLPRCLMTLYFILAIFVLGCSRHEEEPMKGRNSFQKLEEAYRNAHAEKSLEGLIALVANNQEGDLDRSTFLMSFKEDIARPLKAVTFSTIDDAPLEYVVQGVTYVPLFTPKGRMKVEFDTGENDINASSYLVGDELGTWWIIPAAPILGN